MQAFPVREFSKKNSEYASQYTISWFPQVSGLKSSFAGKQSEAELANDPEDSSFDLEEYERFV